jgi:adenine-specific DNA-methyltransferase
MARKFARRLRKNLTDTEQFVWERVRRRQIGGFKFRRQAPVGPYIVDFACFERRLILELDGGQHAEQVLEDQERTRWLEAAGFRVVRFWDHEVFQDWDAIEEHLYQFLSAAPPVPPPQGGRE